MKKVNEIRVALISLFFILALDVSSQDSYSPKDYSLIPPSPTVSALLQYTEPSLDYFRGLPQISLPIYTVKEGSLSVPITLRYHGGGLKVEEKETNVGLSWTLLAGGMVTRNVCGHPDDAIKLHTGGRGLRGLLHQTSEEQMLRNYAKSTVAEYDPSDYVYYQNNRSIQQTFGASYNRGEADMANDIFKLYSNGLTGTFIYNDNHELVLSSPDQITVSPSKIINAYPQEFVVTDVSGTQYYFSEKESTKYKYYIGDPGYAEEDSLNYVSTWHLTKIKTIHNDSIEFHYRQKIKSQKAGMISQKYYDISSEEMLLYLPQYISGRGDVVYNPLLLEKITSTSTVVTFFYVDGISYSEVINKITIQPNTQGAKPVKTFELEYIAMVKEQHNSDRDRLFLSEIKENGQSCYRFSYYTDAEMRLPLKIYSQDYCGYYNAANNRSLIPAYQQNRGGDSNRMPNPNVAVLGSLRSIEYPTGGKTEFIWESHEYGRAKDASVDSGYTTYISKIKHDTLVGLLPESGVRNLKIENFKVNSNTRVYLDLGNYFNFDYTLLYGSEFYSTHTYDPTLVYPTIVFINEDTKEQTKSLTFYLDKSTIYDGSGENIPVPIGVGIYTVELRYPTSIYNSEAQVHIEREFRYAESNCGRIFIRSETLSDQSGATVIEKGYWGGVRIRRIMSYVHNDSTPVIKDYYYGNRDPKQSNGIISDYPEHTSSYYIVRHKYNTVGFESGEVYVTSSQGLSSTPLGSSIVEYARIEEHYSMPDRNEPNSTLSGRMMAYEYTTIETPENRDYNPTQFLRCQPVEQRMWTSRAHYRGNLKRKSYEMGAGGAVFECVEYEYNIYESEELNEFTTDLFRTADLMGNYDYCIGKYLLIPYNKTIKREMMYGNEMCTKTVDYTYFYNSYTVNSDYGLVRSKQTTLSDGTIETVYYTYLNVAGKYVDIIETEVKVIDNIIVDAKRYDYYPETSMLKTTYSLSKSGCKADCFELGQKSASLLLLNIINHVEYGYRYDTMGNIAEIRYRNETMASYLWGYKGMYPIVEVCGLEYNQLLDAVISLGKTPTELLDESMSLDKNAFFSQLRQKLIGYEIKTMLYHWLIGVSEITDARGVTTYFSYDDWGRLVHIKDANHHFIKKYEYNHSKD